MFLIKKNIPIIFLLFIIISFWVFKKSVEPLDGWEYPNCHNFKYGIINLNSDSAQYEMYKILTDHEHKRTNGDKWGYKKKINILIDEFNKSWDSINVGLFCYGYIKTLPLQSEIVLTVDSSGNMINRIIDISTPDDDMLCCMRIHKYYN